jgi:lysophospholipase L1-like esterase
MQLVRGSRGRLAGVVVLVGVALTSAALVDAARGAPAPKSYYMALGDSIAYGFQPTKLKPGARPSDFASGYVDVVAARLRKTAPGLRVVNYGCPGESTRTFVRGGCPAFTDRITLHDTFRGSQLKAALTFLRAHPNEVSPITLTLYGNDWLPVLLDTCKGKVTCARGRGPKEAAALGSRLGSILEQLRAAAPEAEIIVTGAWNPDPGQLVSLRPMYAAFESSIARAAAHSHARIARMLPVFNPPGKGQAQLCALTFICSKGDPHPTDAGYQAMADAVMRTLR